MAMIPLLTSTTAFTMSPNFFAAISRRLASVISSVTISMLFQSREPMGRRTDRELETGRGRGPLPQGTGDQWDSRVRERDPTNTEVRGDGTIRHGTGQAEPGR